MVNFGPLAAENGPVVWAVAKPLGKIPWVTQMTARNTRGIGKIYFYKITCYVSKRYKTAYVNTFYGEYTVSQKKMSLRLLCLALTYT